MASYQDNAAGVTSTIGTDDYLVSGAIEQYGPIIGVLTDGAVYPYYISFIDVADGTDYETGQGTWDSGSNTLARTTIETSSNSNNAVNWGVGDKALWIVQDALLATDMDQMRNGVSKFYLTSAQAANIAASKTKTDLITVTTPANLDTMQADIAAFSAGITYRGNWDASTGVFPGGGTGNVGDFWYCNATGVVDTISFDAGDSIIALVDNASISTFAGNWSRQDSFDAVQSVAGEVGTVTADQLRANMYVVDPFAYKPTLATPIFMIVTGQSNVDDIEEAVTDFPYNTHVWDYAWQTPYGAANSQGSNPAVGYAWENPNPALARTTAPNIGGAIAPDVGYRRGGAGSAGYAAANALQVATGRDVYVLKVAWSGSPISQWQAAGAVKALLDSFVPYVLSIAPLSTAAVTAADIVIWGQSEANMLPTYSPSNYLTPLEYKDAWLGVYNYADGVWWDNDLTRVYCMEATQYVNWSGVSGAGALVDVPYRHEAINAVERWAGDRVTMVSSVGIPWQTVVGPYSGSATYIHYTGDGCNSYGERIADVILGRAQAKGLASSQLYRELVPTLGGNLIGGNYTATGFSNITSTAATITTTNATTANADLNNSKRIQVTQTNTTFGAAPTYNALEVSGATMTYNFFGGVTGSRLLAANTHVFQNAVNGIINTGYSFDASETIKNASGTALSLGGLIGFNHRNKILADTAAVTSTIAAGFTSSPVFETTGGGTLTVGASFGFSSSGSSIGTGATITGMTGFTAGRPTGIVGTITSQAGFSSQLVSSEATNTTHILLGTSTIPTGGVNYAIYQSDTFPSRLNGNLTIASGSFTMSSGSATLTSGNLTLTAGNLTLSSGNATVTGTLSLPQPTVTVTATPTTYPISITGTTTYNQPTASDVAKQLSIAQTNIFQLVGIAIPTYGVVDVRNTYKNLSSAAVAPSLQGGFYSGNTYTADTQSVTAIFGGDFTSAPTFTIASGGTLLALSYTHYNTASVVNTGATVSSKLSFYASPATGSGTITGAASFVSNIAAANTTNTTHVLLGTTTVPAGAFAIYQSDTLVNRFNSGVISPWRGQSGASAAVSVKGDRNLIFANGSTSTITLPTLTSMTTGHTAAQMSGYELVIINDRTTAALSGTDFLLGAGTSFGFSGVCTILAKDSRTFIWNGVDTWL